MGGPLPPRKLFFPPPLFVASLGVIFPFLKKRTRCVHSSILDSLMANRVVQEKQENRVGLGPLPQSFVRGLKRSDWGVLLLVFFSFFFLLLLFITSRDPVHLFCRSDGFFLVITTKDRRH